MREENLRAIEQGRFADLPPGIYGRAAIRSFATAFGFDPAEVLAECESQLTPVAEPIQALCKLNGVRQSPHPVAAHSPVALDTAAPPLAEIALLSWRPLAAAALDACVVAVLLLIVVVCAVTAMMVPIAALGRSGPMFGVMGVVLGSAYYVWFGGLAGRTVGEQVFRVETRSPERASMTLGAIGAGALRAATEDVRFIQGLGACVGHAARHRFSVRTAPQPEPLP